MSVSEGNAANEPNEPEPKMQDENDHADDFDQAAAHLWIPWIPADQNPWGVAILDVRQATLGLLYSTKDPRIAERLVACGKKDGGKSFLDQEPPVDRVLEEPVVPLIYRTSAPDSAEVLADGILFRPQDLAEKWAVFYHQRRLLFVHSWFQELRVVAHVQLTQDGEHMQVTKIMGTFGCDTAIIPEADPMHTCSVLDFLMKQSVLQTPQPAPLPEVGLEANVQTAATYCRNMYGAEAMAAVPFGVRVDPPPSYAQKVVRSISRMHIAVAQGEIDIVNMLLADEATNYMVHCWGTGSTPLFWALTLKDPIPMMQLLLDGGADMDARTDGGKSTILQEACRRHDSPDSPAQKLAIVQFLLDRGAHVLAVDGRGYSALHGAAQTGSLSVLKLLMERGGDIHAVSQDQHQCTVKSIAEKGGHEEMVHYLDQLLAREGYEPVE